METSSQQVERAAYARRKEIEAVFAKHGTDKLQHGYAKVYADIRPDIGNVLEIGVAGGNSLRAWLEIFPRAKVYGIDMNPRTGTWQDPRATILFADSTKVDITKLFGCAFSTPAEVGASMAAVLGCLGPKTFDLIVDDGSHRVEDQIATLGNFHRMLAEYGTYIVEDVVKESVEPLQQAAFAWHLCSEEVVSPIAMTLNPWHNDRIIKAQWMGFYGNR